MGGVGRTHNDRKRPTLEHLQAERTEAPEGPSQLARPLRLWDSALDSPSLRQAGLGIAGTRPVVLRRLQCRKGGVPCDPVVGRRRRRWRGCRLEGLANRSGALE